MAAANLVNPRWAFTVPSTGAPLASGTVQVYIAGTTTPTNTWQNEGLSILNTNPIQLDANGSCTIWVSSSIQYKFLVYNSAGALQYTIDPIIPAETANLRAQLAATTGAGLIGFSQDAVYSAGTVGEKLQTILNVKDEPFGAVGDGTTDDGPAIQAAIDEAAARGGGVVFFPPGTYKTNQSIVQTEYVTLQGDGSRTSIIKWGPATSAALVKGIVYSVAGSDGSPDFVFSTGIHSLGIDGNGVATVGYACRGWQENCIASDLVISGFTTAGLDILSFTNVTHQAHFEDLHIIPKAGSTGAYGVRGEYVSNCSFKNITVAAPIDGTSYYARAFSLVTYNLLNTFQNIHIENATYGFYITDGAENVAIGVEGLCNQTTGTTLYYTTNERHSIMGMRCVSGFTNTYAGPIGGTIAGGSAVDSTLILSDSGYFKRVASAAVVERGVLQHAGTSGNGESVLYVNGSLTLSGTGYVNINIGASDVAFSGNITVRGVGDLRYETRVPFGAYAVSDGTVANSTIGTIGTQNSNLAAAVTIAAPAALASPTAGQFRIGITEGGTAAHAIEVKVEISRTGGAGALGISFS